MAPIFLYALADNEFQPNPTRSAPEVPRSGRGFLLPDKRKTEADVLEDGLLSDQRKFSIPRSMTKPNAGRPQPEQIHL